MKIAGEQTLSAPRQKVWDLFNDPNRLSRLIPGCEKLDVISPTEYAGTLNVGIAAVKGVYSGKLKLEEVRPPEHYKMVVDGKGKQGFMRGSGTLDLVAKDSNTTVVTYAGDVQIGGPLVQVGQRMIDSAAKMMIGQFFAAAEAELKAEAAGKVARQGFFLNFWRYLVRLVRSLFARG
ncbi:MAG TPA: carbon monoxide dehydrogenase subunit G [Candidatus Binataceae bacterium]|jgi:carbon monoxide dehydrogenase subunit G|nr:carbon monoxide dehydrogenase subunit G [Candidatus Binataceae bacterium]